MVRTYILLMYIAALLGLPLQAGAQAVPVERLRIVGGLAAVNQYTRHEERFWTQELARLSGGRYTASIVPFDRAGVPAQEMLNLMTLGVVPFGTALLTQVATQYPELGTADMAGLTSDMQMQRKMVAAFRPYLEKTLRERHGVELLAIYVYPAQELFCQKPMTRLADIAGRRVRVSGATQADFIRALNGTPVFTEFSELMANMRSGNTECAITGTMSGNTLGLHTITRYIYSMPLSWGLSIFAANRDTWNALPADLRALLRSELPKLETAVWTEAERETGEGVACNTGSAGCGRGSKGTMIEVQPSAEDQRLRWEILTTRVLAGWVQRCGPICARVWDETVGPVVGTRAPATK